MEHHEKTIQKKVGILGGSFDPIHNGHLAIAKSAYTDFSLDEIWLMPAGHSPNKRETQMTSAELRLQMTKLAAKMYQNFKASDFEVKLEGTSYTYRTLERLKELYPQIQFFFIMGADSLDYFDTWVHPELICRYATILVAVRDDFSRKHLETKIAQIQTLFSADIQILSIGKKNISSHEIREKIALKEDVSELLPQSIIQFIQKNGLYSEK